MAKLKLSALIAAAEEMIDVMDLQEKNPKTQKKAPIVVAEDISEEDVTKLLKKAITQIDRTQDEFSVATEKVITALSDTAEEEVEEKSTKGKSKAKAPVVDDDEEDPGVEEDEDEEVDDDLKQQVEDAEDRDELVLLCEENAEFEDVPVKKLKKMADLKKAMLEALEPEDKEEEVEEKATKGKEKATSTKTETKAAVKKEKPIKAVKDKGPSPYGTAVEIMCTDPAMSLADLNKKLAKKGIDIEKGKSAINTGYGVVRKITGLLKENGFVKK